jgi:hypothetical protein
MAHVMKIIRTNFFAETPETGSVAYTAGYSHVAFSCSGCTVKCGNAVDRRPERGGPERRHVSTVNARLQSNGTHTPSNVMGGGGVHC